MSVTTLAAHPAPYSTHVQSRGTRAGPTAAACLRCVPLVDDANASAGVLALVLQLHFEHAPTGIEHGFRHPRLCQLRTAHVAYEDALILIDDLSGEPAQGLFAPTRRRAV